MRCLHAARLLIEDAARTLELRGRILYDPHERVEMLHDLEGSEAASSARIASRALWNVVSLAESAAFVVRGQQRASALAPWSAVMLASRRASCAATKASVARPSRLSWCPPPVRVQPVHRGEQGGQRACVRLAEEGGVQGCRGDSVQEGCRYLRVHHRGSVTADCRA